LDSIDPYNFIHRKQAYQNNHTSTAVRFLRRNKKTWDT